MLSLRVRKLPVPHSRTNSFASVYVIIEPSAYDKRRLIYLGNYTERIFYLLARQVINNGIGFGKV